MGNCGAKKKESKYGNLNEGKNWPTSPGKRNTSEESFKFGTDICINFK